MLGNNSWCFVQNGKTLASAKQVVEALEVLPAERGIEFPELHVALVLPSMAQKQRLKTAVSGLE